MFMQLYRAVCASSGEKIERKGQLNEFTGKIDVYVWILFNV